MDGRRHSVDIPISKALVALRRVRSLRDPSTLSMSKFSALLDNVNWETNSNNGISLRFLESCQQDNPDKNRSSRLRNVEEFEFNLYENSELMGNKNARGRNSKPEGSGRRRSYEGEISMNKSSSERYYGNRIEKTCVIPSINPLEDVESSNEPSIGSLQQRMEQISSRRKFEAKKSSGAVKDSSSCSEEVDDHDYDDDDDHDDDDDDDHGSGGCAISCCWSGTPKFREADIENNPLLSRNADDNFSVYSKRLSRQNCKNEIVPHLEAPRSLSQKFRPRSFGELVGQNVVARSLLGAICKGRVTPFYLFHGPRGTGKTSASRIFAAALNCLSSDEQRPCGICRECAIFFSGRSRDVKEVDSVRINKRERVKSLVKRATVPPVSSRFKVYIVDECHLLHGETWATVLHCLDGISRHVVFVMSTSELDKLPRSAVSRAQRYHFPKIKDSDISRRLAKICAEEGLDFDEVALDFVASKSSGSMRDAEMMLDQLSLLGKKITMSLAYELIGIVSDDELLDLLDLAMSSDSSKTVIRARELMRSRIDPMQLISQLANIIMDILAGSQEGCSETRRKFSSRHTSEVDLQKLSNALKILSETEKQLRVSKNQTTWLTVALLQLSSLECSSTEASDSKFWINNASDGVEGLRCGLNCSCEEQKSGTTEDRKRTLELIWKRATELCQSTSLRKFLMERGKLSSLLVSQGVAIAELEFCHPDCISTAENSQQLIANSLQSILGCDVDIRINLIPYASNSIYSKLKKASLRLFGCSRRNRKSHSNPECETNSERSKYASERPVTSDGSIIIPFSRNCASQVPNKFCDRSDTSLENNTPTPVLMSASSNESGCNNNNGARVLSFQTPKNRTKCFPRFRKKPCSMVQLAESKEQNNLALAIMRRTSLETSVDSNHLNIFYNGSNNHTNGSIDENQLGESSQPRCCLRTPKLHIRKDWMFRHKRENSHSVGGWVLPCSRDK